MKFFVAYIAGIMTGGFFGVAIMALFSFSKIAPEQHRHPSQNTGDQND